MRFFILILQLMMVFLIVSAQQTFLVNGIQYKEILTKSNKMCVSVTPIKEDDPNGYPVQSYYKGDVIIPSQVSYDLDTYEIVSIDKWAFWICKGMTSLEVSEGPTVLYPYTIWGQDLKKIILPNSIQRIEDCAIQPSNFTSIHFGSGVKYIGAGLNNLIVEELVIPDSVEVIHDSFCFCSSLKKLVIGQSLTEIGRSFTGCDNVSEVIIKQQNPHIILPDCFRNTTIIIPPGSLEQYKKNWGHNWNFCEN